MQYRSSLTHLSTLLFLPTAIGLAAPPPAASEEVPRPLIEAAIQACYPHTTGLELQYEVWPRKGGEWEVRCKSRRRLNEATFECADDLLEQACTPPSSMIVAECVRAALLDPTDVRRLEREERCVRFDPRFEPLLREAVLLRQVAAEGSIIECYGTLRAEKFVDQWELSAFQPRQRERGQTLLEVQAEVASLRGDCSFVTHVLGSREWEDHLAALKPARDERVERIERANADLAEATRPGLVYFFKFRPHPRRNEMMIGRAEFGGKPGGPSHRLELSLPTSRPTMSSYTVSPEMRRGDRIHSWKKEEQQRAYQRAPQVSPEIQLQVLQGPAGAGPRGALARLGEHLALRMEGGGLVLVDRSSTTQPVLPLTREVAGGATAERNGHAEVDAMAWTRH